MSEHRISMQDLRDGVNTFLQGIEVRSQEVASWIHHGLPLPGADTPAVGLGGWPFGGLSVVVSAGPLALPDKVVRLAHQAPEPAGWGLFFSSKPPRRPPLCHLQRWHVPKHVAAGTPSRRCIHEQTALAAPGRSPASLRKVVERKQDDCQLWAGTTSSHSARAVASPCSDLPDRFGAHKAPRGRPHVASRATSRGRTAEALHSSG